MEIVFVLLMYATAKAMVLNDINGEVEFPTLETPDLDFQEIPASCGGFADCIEYVGKILVNFVLGIVYVVLLIFNLIIFVGQLLILLATQAFVGVEGAPSWLNGALMVPYVGGAGVIIYKMIRKGDTDT